jgi:competence protein ComEA
MIAIARFWHSFARIEKAILLVCSAMLLFFAGGAWSRYQQIETLPPVFEDAPQSQSLPDKTSGAPILVHVAGAVRKPGVLRLPVGARVADALKKSGGARPDGDLNALNLAQKLKDGQQVLVPMRGAQKNALLENGKPKARATKGKIPPHPVNVNTADAEELQLLPGIGPALAARILAKRAQSRFSSLDDLDEVEGLGPKKLAALKPFVRF